MAKSNAKLNEEQKQHVSKMGLIIIAQVAIMVILTFIMVMVVTSKIDEMIVNDNTAITKEKCAELELYMENSTTIINNYSSADEIINVIEHPDDPDAVAAAQKYTEKISETLSNLEGIYVSEWNTHVLAHTNPAVVGITTRTEQGALDELHNGMLNSPNNNIYNAGIIISPASKQQIISMYKAIFNDAGKPVGLVGLGIYTEGIVEDLDQRNTKITSDSQYYMVDVHSKKYVFAQNKELMNTVIDENESPEFNKLAEELAATTENKSGTFTFKRDG